MGMREYDIACTLIDASIDESADVHYSLDSGFESAHAQGIIHHLKGLSDDTGGDTRDGSTWRFWGNGVGGWAVVLTSNPETVEMGDGTHR